MYVCRLKNQIDIKLLMAATGKSLREFSKHVDVSHPYLSQILNGKRNPSPTVAHKIATGLGKDIKDLFIIENRDEVVLID